MMVELELCGRTVRTERKALVMGIVNVTPDSFYEGSRGGLERAMRLVEEGADILDLGAESSRPGCTYIDSDEELGRLIPVIKEIRKRTDVPISIDTRKKTVMQEAFYSGADILNDISALEDDAELGAFCAEQKLPVILMHRNAIEKDAVNEVSEYLLGRAAAAEALGIPSSKIIVDPGIGFNKNFENNCDLIRGSGSLCGGKYKILMALSRKRCIGKMTGRDIPERLYGTLAADIVSVIKGCSLVRVHDVKETIDTLKVLEYTL